MNTKRLPIAEILLVTLGSLLYFVANIQRVAVPGAVFDVLQQDLHTTAQCITSLGASFMYIYAVSQLVIGVLIARYGGFRVITVGSVLFLIGSLLFPFSHSLGLLYFSRVLIGFGSATFYLGMINETKRLVSRKNFGVVLSLILLVGYLGGIIANAPLVICIDKMGWRETFLITGVATTVISLIFLVINKTIKHQPTDKTVHMDLELFKETFSNKKNLYLYSFACLNYGLYYVIQTVLGKKFLEDFCQMPVMQSATILSIMGALYAVAGSIIAFMSKASLNRRTIFLKLASLNTLIVFGSTLVCLILNVRTPIIGVMFCTIAFGASLSPLLVPLLHDYNGARASSTSISVMTAGFYLSVAILGNISGFLLDLFPSTLASAGHYVYSNQSYIAIFGLMTVLAIYSFINVFKVEESQKTLRLISYINYLKEKEEEGKSEEEHWHDEYEHDLYTNV